MKKLALTLALTAVSVCAPVHAQAQNPAPWLLSNQPQPASLTSAVLPVRDVGDESIRAFLLLDFPSGSPLFKTQQPIAGAGVVIPMANTRRVSARLTLDAQPDLGVLCQSRSVTATLGALAAHCLLGGTDASSDPAARLSLRQPGIRSELRLDGPSSQLAASFGLDRYAQASLLSLPGATRLAAQTKQSLFSAARVSEQSLGLNGSLTLGDEGWLSVGGTWAHARLVSPHDPAVTLPSRWNRQSLSVAAGIGKFGGEVIGHSIHIPGQTGNFSSVGLGVTWKTPWRAQLSVGAENLISRGKNPFSPPSTQGNDDEGRVPYVRYQQDL